MAAGARVDVQNKRGETPLDLVIGASKSDNISTFNAIFHALSPQSLTDAEIELIFLPLLDAASKNKTQVVLELLIAAGANVNDQDNVGDTPLHLIIDNILYRQTLISILVNGFLCEMPNLEQSSKAALDHLILDAKELSRKIVQILQNPKDSKNQIEL